MKAEKTRIIIDCIPKELADAMGGVEKAREEINQIESASEIGDAFIWALQEGIISNVAVEPLVRKYKESIK